jgi:hypothetical protein
LSWIVSQYQNQFEKEIGHNPVKTIREKPPLFETNAVTELNHSLEISPREGARTFLFTLAYPESFVVGGESLGNHGNQG